MDFADHSLRQIAVQLLDGRFMLAHLSEASPFLQVLAWAQVSHVWVEAHLVQACGGPNQVPRLWINIVSEQFTINNAEVLPAMMPAVFVTVSRH